MLLYLCYFYGDDRDEGVCVENMEPNDFYCHFFENYKLHSLSLSLQSRIMKDLKTLSDDGTPVSKGYGFISFAEHEHALQALRKVNNNPDIFTVFKVSKGVGYSTVYSSI